MDEQPFRPVALIPIEILGDTKLPPSARVLFGLLTMLSNDKRVCSASNNYIAKLMNTSARSVQRLLSQLAGRGYIRVDVIRDEQTNEVKDRHIYCDGLPGR